MVQGQRRNTVRIDRPPTETQTPAGLCIQCGQRTDRHEEYTVFVTLPLKHKMQNFLLKNFFIFIGLLAVGLIPTVTAVIKQGTVLSIVFLVILVFLIAVLGTTVGLFKRVDQLQGEVVKMDLHMCEACDERLPSSASFTAIYVGGIIMFALLLPVMLRDSLRMPDWLLFQALLPAFGVVALATIVASLLLRRRQTSAMRIVKNGPTTYSWAVSSDEIARLLETLNRRA
jgi:hypothetical protein